MIFLVIGLVTVTLLAAGVVIALYALAGPDPAAEPPLDAGDEPRHDELFRPTRWRKARIQAPDHFNRPLEIEPDNGVMPPPRNVRGVNGEEELE